ncbi:MAG: hypothetical protein P4L79_07770 [Legionella sp.]|nr:hypothetical protein [Legionella sp.]
MNLNETQSVCPSCGYPSHAGHAPNCPTLGITEKDLPSQNERDFWGRTKKERNEYNATVKRINFGIQAARAKGLDPSALTERQLLEIEQQAPQQAKNNMVAESQPAQSAEQEKNPDPILTETLYNEKQIKERIAKFDEIWQQRGITPARLKKDNNSKFNTNPDESPFSKFSSKGWKIHIAFDTGLERDFARLLYSHGLYFKVEGSGGGTYFNGLKESGATIYIGSSDNMQEIAKFLENTVGSKSRFGSKMHDALDGSGADVVISPKIAARFDVAKTAYGWHSGNGKYAEHGIATGLTSILKVGEGLPVLKKFEKRVSEIEHAWNTSSQDQRKLLRDELVKICDESKQELVKDFGEEFLLGKQQPKL